MGKRLYAVVVLIIVLSLCACGDSSKASNSEKTDNTQASTTMEIDTETVEDDSNSSETACIEVGFGEKITNDIIEFTIDKTWYSFDIVPSNTAEAHSYFEGEDGKQFFYAVGTTTNVSPQEINFINSKVEIIFDDKYTYTGTVYTESNDNTSVWQASQIVPFETVKFYLCAAVPDEMINRYEKVQIIWDLTELGKQVNANDDILRYSIVDNQCRDAVKEYDKKKDESEALFQKAQGISERISSIDTLLKEANQQFEKATNYATTSLEMASAEMTIGASNFVMVEYNVDEIINICNGEDSLNDVKKCAETMKDSIPELPGSTADEMANFLEQVGKCEQDFSTLCSTFSDWAASMANQ